MTLLHLAFHCRLCLETLPFEDLYHWVEGWLHDENEAILCARLATIWEKNGAHVPFGIAYKQGSFAEDGALLLTGIGEGLTCATFVLDVFHSLGMDLIDIASWPKRSSLGDEQWHKDILEVLRHHATKEHVDAQVPLIGLAARFRPQHVAGSFGIYQGKPIKFESAKKQASKVTDALCVARD